MIVHEDEAQTSPTAVLTENIPASFRRQLDAVKHSARIERVAQDYGEFKLAGSGRLRGRCVSPNHEDRTPSLMIYIEEQRFRCFGCGEHGDVLDLVRLVESCELWEAMVAVSTRHGIDLPGRPASWFAKQERQKPVRDAIKEAKLRVVQRRLFRLFIPLIEAIEDEAERREEIERVWDDTREIAVLMLAGRAS